MINYETRIIKVLGIQDAEGWSEMSQAFSEIIDVLVAKKLEPVCLAQLHK